MLKFEGVLELVRKSSKLFKTVVIITNGYYLAKLTDNKRLAALQALDAAGLTVLSVSRHGVSEEENAKVMYLNTSSSLVSQTWAENVGDFENLKRMRWVCVLQKDFVDSPESVREYVDFCADSGVGEVCFKELYVSTSTESIFHNEESNKFSAEHQVPLSLVLDFCEEHGFKKVSELPWGAPIYEGNWRGRRVKIAAYTEPSVFWERVNGVCRSWNLMADSECLVTLEDGGSGVLPATT